MRRNDACKLAAPLRWLALAARRVAQDSRRPTTSRSTASCCRTAIRPSCGKRAARRCGRQTRGPKQGVARERATSARGRASSRAPTRELPRYFADADRVMDLETRLVHCMVTLQGFTPAEATQQPFGSGSASARTSRRWSPAITAESRGRDDERRRSTHPKEQRGLPASARRSSSIRGGPHDFACATCHGETGKRIRLQDLPNLTEQKDAQRALHDLARVSRLAGRAAHDAVAALRLLPAAALPRARVHLRRVDRADDVPRAQRATAASFDAPGHQALRRPTMNASIDGRCRGIAGARCRLRRRCPTRRSSRSARRR